MLSLCIVQSTFGQEKKDNPIVETTDKAGKWSLSSANVGTKILSDKTYTISDLPKEMEGGTLVCRSSGEFNKWLPASSLKSKVDVTAYAMIRVKILGKGTKRVFSDMSMKNLAEDGWMEIDGKVGTTFPSAEGWEWKAFKKDVDAGDIVLKLNKLGWEKNGTTVVFIFKQREEKK
jgi:hypothetical protein